MTIPFLHRPQFFIHGLSPHPEEEATLRLDSAIEVTHVAMESDTIDHYEEAVNQYQSILTQAIDYPVDSFTAYFLHNAYDRMVQALGNAVAEGQIAIGYDQPLNEPFQQVLTVQDTMINRIEERAGETLTYDAYQRIFKVALDKAHVYRLGQKRQQAINILNGIQGWAQPAELKIVNYWQCVNQAEQKVLSDAIHVDSFQQAYNCQYPYDSIPIRPNLNLKLEKREVNNTSEKPNKPHSALLKVFPNPVKKATSVAFTLQSSTEASLTLLNLKGKPVQTILEDKKLQCGPHQFRIQTGNLAAGQYVIALTQEGGQTHYKKVIVQ